MGQFFLGGTGPLKSLVGYQNSQACWNAGAERCHIEGHQDLILHQDQHHDKLSKGLLVPHRSCLSCGQYTSQELRHTVGHKGWRTASCLCSLDSPYSNGTLPAELLNCMYSSLESRLISWVFIFLTSDSVGSFSTGYSRQLFVRVGDTGTWNAVQFMHVR